MRFKNYLSALIIIGVLTGCEKDSHKIVPHQDGETQTIFKHATQAVNVVFIGDGYTEADLSGGGKYETDALQLSDYLFQKHPYSAYESSFNAYIVYAQSNSSGADPDPTMNVADTKFNCTYNYSGIDRLLVSQNTALCYEYAAKAVTAPDIIILVVNDEKYGGSGGTITTVSTNGASPLILLHELGHSFGGLADEYADNYVAQFYPLSQIEFYPNVDATNDLAAIKWHYFLGISKYAGVGAYEGGFYRSTNVWRPEAASIMVALNYEYYNASSREAIVKKIFSIVGQPFVFQDFVDKDIVGGLSREVATLEMLPPPAFYTEKLYKLR